MASGKFFIGAGLLGILGAAALAWFAWSSPKSDSRPAPPAMAAVEDKVAATAKVPETAEKEPLSVSVESVAKSTRNNSETEFFKYTLAEFFDVALRVVNSSPSAQSITYMSCSYPDQWKTDCKDVWILSWPCEKNKMKTKILMPGESFLWAITVGWTKPATGVAHPKATFKMGFTSLGSKRTFWSDDITIPPSDRR